MTTSFAAPTRIVTGLGCLDRLDDELHSLGPGPLAVVADRGVATAGLLDRVLGAAESPPAATVLVSANPGVDEAETAAAQARNAHCETVLAVGGGSTLGLAKAVAIRLTNPDRITAYEGQGRMPNRPAPTLAVPTTAGSGSEVSNALVLHEAGRQREIVVRGVGCEPRVALLDGTLLAGLPDLPMTYAALDALTHALEALWARHRSAFSDAMAVMAADAILDTLPRALDSRRPADLQQLLEASCAANLACGNSGLGLVHALSSAPSVPLPHGYQNGVLLPVVARFNSAVLDVSHRRFAPAIDRLYERIGFDARFAPGVLDAVALDAMLAASTGHPFRANNARPSTDGDIIAILRDAGVAREEVPR